MGILFGKAHNPQIQPRMPEPLPIVAPESFEAALLRSSDGSMEQADDRFDIWNGTSISQGGYVFLYRVEHGHPDGQEALRKEAAMFRRFLAWYEQNQPRHLMDQTERMGEIKYACNQVLGM